MFSTKAVVTMSSRSAQSSFKLENPRVFIARRYSGSGTSTASTRILAPAA